MSTFEQALDPNSIASTRENIRLMKEYAIVWFTVLVWDTVSYLSHLREPLSKDRLS